jgi:hypothetical protein
MFSSARVARSILNKQAFYCSFNWD